MLKGKVINIYKFNMKRDIPCIHCLLYIQRIQFVFLATFANEKENKREYF